MMPLLLAASVAVLQPSAASPYDEAVTARRSGDSAQAAVLLEKLTQAEPANADAWVQYGYALRDLGRTDEALAAFNRALAIAPDYQDARDGIAQIARSTPAQSRLRINIDGALTSVRNARDWSEARVEVAAPVAENLSLSGSLEHTRRFGKTDLYGEVRLEANNPRQSSYYLLVGATPSADYRPEWQLGAGGTYVIAGGSNPLVATFDSRVARYSDDTIWTATPGFQQYLGDGRFWLTGQWINLLGHGQREDGWLGRFDVQATDRARLFAGYSNAPDLSEGTVLRTKSLFGGLSLSVSERVNWRVSVARDKPSNNLDRTTVATGLSLSIP